MEFGIAGSASLDAPAVVTAHAATMAQVRALDLLKGLSVLRSSRTHFAD